VAPPSDTQGFLSETRLCEIAGVKRQRRQWWAQQGLLRRLPGSKRYCETDAVELAALTALVSALGFDDAVLAWPSVRESLPTAIAARGRLDVVFDHQVKEGVLLTDARAIGSRVRSGHLFRVIPLEQAVASVRSTVRRIRGVTHDTRKERSVP